MAIERNHFFIHHSAIRFNVNIKSIDFFGDMLLNLQRFMYHIYVKKSFRLYCHINTLEWNELDNNIYNILTLGFQNLIFFLDFVISIDECVEITTTQSSNFFKLLTV